MTPEQIEEMMAEMTLVDPYRSIMVGRARATRTMTLARRSCSTSATRTTLPNNVDAVEEILADGTLGADRAAVVRAAPGCDDGAARRSAGRHRRQDAGHFRVAFEAMIARDLFVTSRLISHRGPRRR
ncbi:MAG: hypothetical protein WKF58_03385 [Ilumatobacteraceae bacterium]